MLLQGGAASSAASAAASASSAASAAASAASAAGARYDSRQKLNDAKKITKLELL